MIAKMKKTVIAASRSQKDELLVSLRDLGVMHITDMISKSQSLDALEKERSEYDHVLQVLKERGGKKVKAAKAISGEEFASVHGSLVSLLAEEDSLNGSLIALRNERERISPFGDFNPDELTSLASEGIDIHIYTGNAKDAEILRNDPDCNFIPVAYNGKGIAIALVSIDKGILEGESRLKEIASKISEAAAYVPSYESFLKRKDEAITFERVSESVEGDDIIYLTGYIPEEDEDAFKSYAKKHSLAYMLSDPDDEDNPPTKINYKGFVRIVKPVFDILGVVPGYREYDISTYFLLFFSLFFAMIVGDAGYGLIFLIAAIVMNVRAKKCSDTNILLYVLSATTIIYGAVTGTWFGSLSVLEKLPFLQLFIIPSICNYSMELYGIESVYAQNAVMQLCFMLGAAQLGLACVLNVISKIRVKDLSLLGDIGWLMDVCVLYMMALYLVIGASVDFTVVIVGVAVGFFLVVVFGSQEPGKSFAAGLKSGLGGFFTSFLDTVSCFSNIMSYIRLFAVGMASLAIAQSFNSMADMAGPVFGAVIVVLGTVLNIVMGLLSVIVHGVRLNLLEFSGQLGMEWTGYKYDPFRETVDKTESEQGVVK